MARFLFASTDFAAHLDWGGLLLTAEELKDRGHDVLWCTGPRVRALVGQHGLATRCVPVVDPGRGQLRREPPEAIDGRESLVTLWRHAFRAPRRTAGGIAPSLVRPYALLVRVIAGDWLQEDAMATSCEAVARLIDSYKPDVVVAEPLMLPAALAAEARGVPCASCGYPGPILTVHPLAVLEPMARRIGLAINRLRARVGLDPVEAPPDPDLFFFSRDLQIVYLPPDWYGELGARRAPEVLFAGSRTGDESAGGAAAVHPGSSGRLIAIAVSSSYLPDARLLRAIFDAVAAVDARGIIGGPPEARRVAEPLPPHIEWRAWLDYDRTLPAASAFIHHGGLGTTHAGVRAAIPHLVLPGPVDQCLHADAIARGGVGRVYTGPPVTEPIAAALHALFASLDEHRGAARRLRAHFASYGGVSRAATALLQLAGRAARR